MNDDAHDLDEAAPGPAGASGSAHSDSWTRRVFLQATAGAGAGVALGPHLPAMQSAEVTNAPPPGAELVDVKFKINGRPFALRLDPRVSLLDVLRENLSLSGTKKGCD